MQRIPPKSRRFKGPVIILSVIAVIAFGLAIFSAYDGEKIVLQGLAGNLGTELFGALITYLIIDGIIRNSTDKADIKQRLIRQLENHDSGEVNSALRELYARGWLQDGSLYGWFLKRANLQKADLRNADINELGLYRCDLTEALIDEEQLAVMSDLRKTIMPDGQLYDGRYCLTGDMNWATKAYGHDINRATPQEMADYYTVPLERYLEGQKWAKANLERFGRDLPPYLRRMKSDD